ncbi:protein Abitram [Achroia grisella]|uniref:protein Abitram n=1 Tax=Achroia grisella TaxID=688607 RepID=UPI0027D34911|nr:protein Abitram [Achroia grisella]
MDFKILDSIPDLAKFKSFTDRYFSKRYILNVEGIKNNDIMLMFHSNRITLLSLAPSHYFFKKNEKFKINFDIGKIDRLSNSVKGKGKKGGQLLLPKSVICKVEYDDGESFDIPCCMKGTLIEVNEELVKHPELLKEMPDSNGFIAIILSSIAISEATKNELLSHEDYMKIIANEASKN